MSTDDLEKALEFATADEHSGDLRVCFLQAKAACRTLVAEIDLLKADLESKDGERPALEAYRLGWPLKESGKIGPVAWMVTEIKRLQAGETAFSEMLMDCLADAIVSTTDAAVVADKEVTPQYAFSIIKQALAETKRLRAEIDAARQEAFRYGFQRDCDDSDPAEVAEADDIVSLVSCIAQAESQARGERDGAICRLRDENAALLERGGAGK